MYTYILGHKYYRIPQQFGELKSEPPQVHVLLHIPCLYNEAKRLHIKWMSNLKKIQCKKIWIKNSKTYIKKVGKKLLLLPKTCVLFNR